MKKCEEYAALLDMYVDGFVTDEEAVKVRKHLAECESCRMYVEQILQMKEAFPDAEETEVPEGFAENVMAAIRAEAAPRKRRLKTWQKTLVQMAACIAVVIALGPISEVVTGVGGGANMETAMSASAPGAYAPGGTAAYSVNGSEKSMLMDAAENWAKADSDAETTAPVPTAPSAEPQMPAEKPQEQTAPGTASDSSVGGLKVKLTRAQVEELLSGYQGTERNDAVIYALSAAEMAFVLAKIPAGSIIPGSDMDTKDGSTCYLIVYPAE